MAKVLVLFYSRTGNTEVMARQIVKGMQEIPGVEIRLAMINKVSVQEWLNYDGLIIGSPTYYGATPAEVKTAIDASVDFHGRLAGKLGGAFASSANVGGGNETTVLGILHAWLIHGMVVMGDAFGYHYGPVSIGAPDERVVRGCDRYGKLFGELAKKMFG